MIFANSEIQANSRDRKNRELQQPFNNPHNKLQDSHSLKDFWKIGFS